MLRSLMFDRFEDLVRFVSKSSNEVMYYICRGATFTQRSQLDISNLGNRHMWCCGLWTNCDPKFRRCAVSLPSVNGTYTLEVRLVFKKWDPVKAVCEHGPNMQRTCFEHALQRNEPLLRKTLAIFQIQSFRVKHTNTF